MAIDSRAERQEQADRLREARIKAGFKSMPAAARAMRVNVETYKAHESARNGFDTPDARIYARAFKVSPSWLVFGEDTVPKTAKEHPNDAPIETPVEDEGPDDGFLTIAEMKQRFARSLGIDPSSIKIIIEA